MASWKQFTQGLAARLGALEYDSGRRSLALPEGVTGNIYVQRIGRWVTVWIGNTSPVAGDLVALETLGPEFAPANSLEVQVKGGALSVHYDGTVSLVGGNGRYGAGVVTYRARSAAIPTNLPGVST